MNSCNRPVPSAYMRIGLSTGILYIRHIPLPMYRVISEIYLVNAGQQSLVKRGHKPYRVTEYIQTVYVKMDHMGEMFSVFFTYFERPKLFYRCAKF